MTRSWIIAALLGAVGAAQAQTPAAPAPPAAAAPAPVSAARKELAAKLVALQRDGIDGVGRSLAAQASQRVLLAAGQGVMRVPAVRREAVAQEVQAEIRKFHEEMEPILRDRAAKLAPGTLAPVYEQRFTDAELRTVIAWIENPAAKKFQQVDAELGRALAEKVVADVKPTLEARLKTLEVTVNGKLGPPPSAIPGVPPPAPAPAR